MKRTQRLIEHRGSLYLATKKITCKSVGQMADGTMVWVEVGTDGNDQYMLFKLNGGYYFMHM